MRLSVNVIVRDGITPPSDVVRAIGSIAPVADEIVVVDTGSKDGTVQAIRAMGEGKVRLFRHGWRFDFAEARNYALYRSTGDWIFWLDADEEVPPESARRIRELVDRGERKGYIFILVGPNLTGTPQLRLFPNLPNLRWRYAVHEQIAPSLLELGVPIVKTDVKIIHHGYSDLSKIDASWRRNGEIARLHLNDGEWYRDVYRSYIEYLGGGR